VVNYLTRDSFKGLEVRGDYQATTRSDDQSDSEISLIWGGELASSSSLVFAFSHFERERLQLLERGDLPRMTESSFGAPGSLFLLEPSPTIPNSVVGAFNADPECDRATSARLVVQANGGTQCFYDFGTAHTLVPDETRNSAYAILDKEYSPHLQLRGELGWAKNETRFNFSSSLPMLNLPLISAEHPGNPWAADGLLRFRAFGDGDGAPGSGATPVFADHETTRVVLEATGEFLSSAWEYNVAYTYSRNKLVDSQPDQSESRLRRALAGFGGADCDAVSGNPGTGECLYFNPFGTALDALPGDPDYNTPEVIHFINSENIRREQTSLEVAELTFAGTLAPLPAGDLQAALGYQRRQESRNRNMSDDANNGDLVFLVGDPDFNVDRTVDAYFAELFAPVFTNDFGSMEAQLAVRYEDYDTGFDSIDPKVGLHFLSAKEAFAIRLTYGTSFRAPTLFQQYVTSTALLGNFDPLTETVGFAAQTATGSEALEPEESENYNIGITLRPMDGLQLDVDFWDIEYTDRIVQQNGQSLINDEAQALLAAGCTPTTITTNPECLQLTDPQIVRDPVTGSPSRVFVERFNAAELEASGLDVQIVYSWATNVGLFSIGNMTSYVSKFDLLASEGAPKIDGAGKRNEQNSLARAMPEVRSNTTFAWSTDRHQAALIIRYISEYEDSRGDIDSWIVGDLQYTYTFDLGSESRVSLTLGALNLTDEDPPDALGQGAGNEYGYDTKVHDPRGRMLYGRFAYQL
jgi:outer membrane receptor protein involved in Fe transport